MITTAIILAGGFGTRLKEMVADVPKPMAPVNGVPFLNYQFNYLKHYGIKTIVVSTGHLAEKITEYYSNNFSGLKLIYSHEATPLGTGGGIHLAMENSKEPQAFVLNGDSFFDVDLLEFYKSHTSAGLDFSMAVRQVEDASRYGTIQLENFSKEAAENNFHRVKQFSEKTGLTKPGIINGGIYILNKTRFLALTPSERSFSIEKDFFETHLTHETMGAYLSDGYFLDIGIPQDYLKAQHDFKGFKYQ